MTKWKWYVCIALCADKSYYTGMTWNPAHREFQHQSGKGSQYTSKHGFVKIIYLEEYENLELARMREKQIQGWSRSKKEKLITGEWKQNW